MAFALLSQIVWAGCGGEPKPPPPVVAISTPSQPLTTATPITVEENRKVAILKKPPAGPRPSIRNPFRPREDKPLPKLVFQSKKPKPTTKPKRARTKPTKPSLGLEPIYPTRQQARPRVASAQKNDKSASGSGMEIIPLVAASGKSELARPYYHPSVKFLELVEYPYLDVQFQVQANGRAKVQILTPIRDLRIHHISMLALNRWKWIPKKVKGVPVDSVVVLRLKKSVR